MFKLSKQEMKERFEGTLVGLAVGDALGAPVEFNPETRHFMTADEIRQKFGTVTEMIGGGALKLKPGEYTDDTNMMLCIAESLVQNRGYRPGDIAQRFVIWYNSKPRDMGRTTRIALRRIAEGVSWRVAGDLERPTNGSVMRCAPIGLMYFGNWPELIRVSIETSGITHAHIESSLSCVLINEMIASLVSDNDPGISFAGALGTTGRLYNKDFHLKCIDGYLSPDKLDPNGRAMDTALLAIKSFMNTASFEEAVVAAVKLGGDTDTIAAVTGALAGAYYGITAIPERWSSKLNPYSAEKIREIADDIFELARRDD